jgi:hypothetical protein
MLKGGKTMDLIELVLFGMYLGLAYTCIWLTGYHTYPCSLRWFETCSSKPVSRDLPSSLVPPRGAPLAIS